MARASFIHCCIILTREPIFGINMTKPLRIQPTKLSEQLAQTLEQHILDGVYAVGERLPSERQMAEDFGVSRPSVRDALSTLAARQLIETRHGGGHYVSERLHADFLSLWQNLLTRHEYMEQDVLEFRRAFDGVMAGLAAERATETDLERIQFRLQQMDSAAQTENVALQSEADVGFHQAIAEASHNVLFSHLSSSLLTMLHRHTQKNLANMFEAGSDKRQLRMQHQAIYDAVLARDAARASALAQAHIDYVADTLRQARAQSARESRAQALAYKDQAKKPRAVKKAV